MFYDYYIICDISCGLRGRPFMWIVFPEGTMFGCGWVDGFWPSGYWFVKFEKISTPINLIKTFQVYIFFKDNVLLKGWVSFHPDIDCLGKTVHKNG